MARKTRKAVSSSLTRTMPSPIEPKSGFTITSPPSRSRASYAASIDSQTTVAGVGSPCRSSVADVQNLSTVRSMTRAEFHPDAALLERVERVHPEDDLLERAVRDDAGENQIHIGESGRPALDVGAVLNSGDQVLVARERGRMAALAKNPEQLVGVPAGP